MRALRFEESRRFDVPTAELWPLLSDTARLNRAIGLRAVSFKATPRADGGSTILGEYRMAGVPIARWTEHSFNFVRPQRYNVVREYTLGPLRRLDGGVSLTEDGGGTLVRVYADILPRNVIGLLLAKHIVGPASTSRVLEQCSFFEQYLADKRANPFPQLVPRTSADERQLDEMIARLNERGADPAITRPLREHIRAAYDDRVVRMRPFELADEWGTDRHATLVVFLQATTVGLLRLGWDAICPNCRIPKAEYSILSDVKVETHCDVCNMVFETNFDRLVEVRFTVASSVRDVEVNQYCVGGPQNMPHVVAQEEMEPGAVVRWSVPPDAKTLRLASPQAAAAALIDINRDTPGDGLLSAGAPDTVPRNFGDLTFHVGQGGVEPDRAVLHGSDASVVVENRTGALALIKLEDRVWPDTAATAALVSTLQEFRDLFAADVLAPGLEVGIERLAILFTDIAGSTHLYEQVGQARAFRVVQDHFRVIEAAVRENRGAIVKTIGDAVMAVFPTVPQALRAAFAMQRNMASVETFGALDPSRLLRVGIHAGPCLAVTLNDRIDYFGTTVNVASRVEHEAAAGEAVMTRDAFLDPGVEAVVLAECAGHVDCAVQLRGISSATEIVRIPCFGEAEPSPAEQIPG